MATSTYRRQGAYYCDDCGEYVGHFPSSCHHDVRECIRHIRKMVDGDSYAEEFHWNRNIDGDEG